MERLIASLRPFFPRSSFMFEWRESHEHIGLRSRERRTVLLEKINLRVNFHLFVHSKELRNSMPCMEYSFKRILQDISQTVNYRPMDYNIGEVPVSPYFPACGCRSLLDYVATFQPVRPDIGVC
jgi:hypothetical protein